MGKGGRIACIFTPMALTIASFVCLVFIEAGGWSKSSGTLNGLYFFEADFTNLDVSGANTADNTTALTNALEQAKNNHALADIYQIHLWNFCSSANATALGSSSNETISSCSKRQSEFYFDPVTVWQLNSTTTSSSPTPTTTNGGFPTPINNAKNALEADENEILGKGGKDALDAYREVAKWMFIAYEVSFWATLATIVCGILAIFSRWGSFFTWLFSVVSSLFTLGAVLTSTILFGAFVGAFHTLLHPYGVDVKMGTSALGVTWLAVICSWAATLFWLFSVCCCSGRSNPHHRGNKGGLWNAEPGYGRGRGMRVEKTGGPGYERVTSPYVGAAGGPHGDRVPLQQYPSDHQEHQGGSYEPYRHS